MSRFRRGKHLVSLCLVDQQESINQLAMELEEESSFLFPPSTTSHQVEECQELDDAISTITEFPSNLSILSADIMLTPTITTLTTTNAATVEHILQDTTNSHLETRSYSESPNNTIPGSSEKMHRLNEKTGCFESDLENNCVSDISEEEEVFTSETQKRKKNRKMRLLGKKYIGHKVVKVDENTKTLEVSKQSRKLRDKPCNHGASQLSDRSFSCAAITDTNRKDIFNYFWQLATWDAKKSYINGLTQVRNVLRRRKTSAGVHQKSYGFDCYLPGLNGVKVRVCKEMFLATFDLKKDTLQLWIRSNCDLNEKEGSSDIIRRIDRNPNNSVITPTTLKSKSVNEWLECVPKVPSHYCRATSNRIYVEESFESFVHMHSVYTSWCQENNKYAVKRKKFQEILSNNNISIFKPRKDQCDVCVGHKQGNVSDECYQQHIEKKDEARAAKTQAVKQASDDVMVLSMDMQSVLLCPKLLVSEQYYKMKLAMHNYTFRVQNTKDAYLYVWHEGDGGVTANNVTSCIVDFIKKYCGTYKKVIMISDGCSYQNRNKVVCSSLANLSQVLGIVIEQIILEKGHTMMEVDSVHSTLEKKFKAPIYAPSDYIFRMMHARPSQPYIVHHLDYTFFKNYEDVPGGFTSIRPGRKTGDPTVTDIRGLLYVNGDVKYKLRHSDDWETLPQRRFNTSETREPTNLYNAPLKIDGTKFNHLQSFKQYMHRDYHHFYDNLHH